MNSLNEWMNEGASSSVIWSWKLAEVFPYFLFALFYLFCICNHYFKPRISCTFKSIFNRENIKIWKKFVETWAFFFFLCVSGGEGVHAVLPLPDSGLDCGLVPVSAQQQDADGAGEGSDVDAEQGRHQVRRKYRTLQWRFIIQCFCWN